MPRLADASLIGSFEHMRADYNAARANRFRRQRSGYLPYGSGADWHYRIAADYFRMIEDARCMDRDDAIVGSTVDKAVTNTIQDGFRCDPQTGDKEIDKDLRARWDNWAKDPQQCDLAGELTFWEMEHLALRHVLIDGDVLGLGNRSGAVELVEGHRLRTPNNTRRNVILGVLVDPSTRRHLEYWLTIADQPLMSAVEKVSEIKPYRTYDSDGNRQVFHAHVGKRFSQTRGVTAFAPIIDLTGMVEDINFATLVQRQMVACFAIFRERDLGFDAAGNAPVGETKSDDLQQNVARMLTGVGPGMIINGQPGEKYRMDSPHVPNPEYFPHMRLIITLIGINLGLPLVMVLMDASETNFSGYRGAVDQARIGFRHNQRRLRNRWHKPIYEWKVRQWQAEDPLLDRAAERDGINILGHRWNFPTWPYIQPLQDASADLLRMRNGLISARRRAAERGIDNGVLQDEIVEDNATMIEKAHLKAQDLNERYPGLNVSWREVASLPTPDGVKISVNAAGDVSGDEAPAGKPAGDANKSAADRRQQAASE